MTEPLVSIAMCTYNGERFIKEQLDSILNQTHKNLEIIITDDCSTDHTIKIIKNYQCLDNRIKLYQNETNLGFSKNFEKAISICNGEYIALSDQDDIWKKHKITKFLLEIKNHVLIYSDAILIDEYTKELQQNLIEPHNRLVSGKCNKSFLQNNFISGNTLLFKRELIKYILPIPHNISHHDIWIAFVASTYNSIIFTQESMTYYRRYEEQVTHQKKVIHKNIIKKLKYKKTKKLADNRIQLNNLRSFRLLNILIDPDTIMIIDEIIKHLENYENTYFNFKLYKLLKKYTKEIFAGYRQNKIRRRAFRISVGLKLKIITFYRI